MPRFNQTAPPARKRVPRPILARGVSCLAAETVEMQANIVIVGATRGFETLTYSIPPTLDGWSSRGIEFLAPLPRAQGDGRRHRRSAERFRRAS